MLKHDLIRLLHMRDAVEEAISFVRSRDRESFDQDRMLVLALVKDIEIVGEAASRISTETQQKIQRYPGQISLGCETASFTPTLISTLIFCGKLYAEICRN